MRWGIHHSYCISIHKSHIATTEQSSLVYKRARETISKQSTVSKTYTLPVPLRHQQKVYEESRRVIVSIVSYRDARVRDNDGLDGG